MEHPLKTVAAITNRVPKRNIEKSFNERIAALTSSQRQLEQAVLQGVEGGAK